MPPSRKTRKNHILEAKNNLSQLIKAAQAGEEVVIAKRSEPVVRLVPVRPEADAKAEPGSPQAIRAWLKNRRFPDCARRSAEEIEADIREARESWD